YSQTRREATAALASTFCSRTPLSVWTARKLASASSARILAARGSETISRSGRSEAKGPPEAPGLGVRGAFAARGAGRRSDEFLEDIGTILPARTGCPVPPARAAGGMAQPGEAGPVGRVVMVARHERVE